MRILVIGRFLNPLGNLPLILNLSLGLKGIRVVFDYYPGILNYDYSKVGELKQHIESAGLKCPRYEDVFDNVKKGVYGLIITVGCGLRNMYERNFLLRLIRQSLPSNSEKRKRAGGLIVLDWIRSGIDLPPFVVLDKSDDFLIPRDDYELLARCALYFKIAIPFNRYLCFEPFKHRLDMTTKIKLASKLRPVWFSFHPEVIHTISTGCQKPYGQRAIDINYLCDVNTSYIRHRVQALLDNAFRERKKVDGRHGRVDRHDYFKMLADSKICVSMPGAGWDCFRHYEAMMSGTLLLVTRPYIEVAVKFKDGHNCVFVENDLEDFVQKLGYYLDNTDVSAGIASNGYLYAKEQLDNRKLAEYIVNETIGVL